MNNDTAFCPRCERTIPTDGSGEKCQNAHCAEPYADICDGFGNVIIRSMDPVRHWPDPTPEMLLDPRFEAIWQVIKSWDINVPAAYGGYCGATGNHVRAILDALAMQTGD